MDWLCTEEFVEVEHKSRSNLVVGHSWDPYLVRIASSLGRSSEKRSWLCNYASLPEPCYHVLHWLRLMQFKTWPGWGPCSHLWGSLTHLLWQLLCQILDYQKSAISDYSVIWKLAIKFEQQDDKFANLMFDGYFLLYNTNTIICYSNFLGFTN